MNLPGSPKISDDLKNKESSPFPNLPKEESSKKFKTENLILPLILLLLLGLLALNIFLYFKYRSLNKNIFDTTKQTSEVSDTISERAQIYELDHEPTDTNPHPYKIVIDPIDPKLGETLKLTIYIENTTPIIAAKAILETDNDSLEQPLTLSNGNASKGIWTTNWKLEDTYISTFQINLIITDDTETYEEGIKVI